MKRASVVVLVVLVPVACAWSVLLLAAPLVAAGASSGWVASLSAGSYLVGGLVCHQQPHRSFHVQGAQLPVCARCAGLYWAGTAGLLLSLLPGLRRARWRAGFVSSARLWLVAAALPTAITVLAEWADWWHPSGLARAVAALPLGLVAGVLVGQTLSFQGKL